MKKILAIIFVLVCGFGMNACGDKKQTKDVKISTNSNPAKNFSSPEEMYKYLQRTDASYYMLLDMDMGALGKSTSKAYIEGNKGYSELTISAFGQTVKEENYTIVSGSTTTSYELKDGEWVGVVQPEEEKEEDYVSKAEFSDYTYSNGKYTLSSDFLTANGITKFELYFNDDLTKMTMCVDVEVLGFVTKNKIEYSYFGQISVNLPSGIPYQNITTTAPGTTTKQSTTSKVITVA